MTTHIHTIDDGARVTVSEHDSQVSLIVDRGSLALAAYLNAAQARIVAATLDVYADALDGEDLDAWIAGDLEIRYVAGVDKPEIRAATGGSDDETGAPAPVQPGNGTEPHSALTDARMLHVYDRPDDLLDTPVAAAGEW